MTSHHILLENLSIGYSTGNDAAVIAENINEKVETGTLVCLIGPNGGGKSTLFRTIGGLLKPLSGEVIINGMAINKINPRKLGQYIGMVSTKRLAVNSMTGYELVSMGRAPYTGFFGRLTQKDKNIIDRALIEVRADNLKDRKVSELSDGERQKLMIAKTLAQDTPIIILDEPTAFLDYPSKVMVMRLLKRLCSEHKKIIFISTHDLDIAFALTDYLWIIDKNIGFCTGTVDSLGSNGTIDQYFQATGMKYCAATRSFVINDIE